MTKKTFNTLLVALAGLAVALLLWFYVLGPSLMRKLVDDANAGEAEITIKDESKMGEIKSDPKFEENLRIKAKEQQPGDAPSKPKK